jgi:hypothetical protein
MVGEKVNIRGQLRQDYMPLEFVANLFVFSSAAEKSLNYIERFLHFATLQSKGRMRYKFRFTLYLRKLFSPLFWWLG